MTFISKSSPMFDSRQYASLHSSLGFRKVSESRHCGKAPGVSLQSQFLLVILGKGGLHLPPSHFSSSLHAVLVGGRQEAEWTRERSVQVHCSHPCLLLLLAGGGVGNQTSSLGRVSTEVEASLGLTPYNCLSLMDGLHLSEVCWLWVTAEWSQEKSVLRMPL